MTALDSKVTGFRDEWPLSWLHIVLFLGLIVLAGCSRDETTTSEVALTIPRALQSARTADCISGTVRVGELTQNLEINKVTETATATIAGISPGTVQLLIEFFCFGNSVAQASQIVSVVAGQTTQVAFVDNDFTIRFFWDVTKWDEGRWEP